MRIRCLVVDDNPGIVDTVSDILDSLGHEYDCADSVLAAREFLAVGQYDYHLFDLELPVKKGRGIPRIENGVNLISEARDRSNAPILVITSHGKKGPKLAVDVMKRGAIDFINKPFPQAGPETLDRKILEALSRHAKANGTTQPKPKPGKRTSFRGGELVFYRERVELNGVKICGTARQGKIRLVLDLLRQLNSLGRYVALSGSELASAIGGNIGQNGVAGFIRDFRKKVTGILLEELNVDIGREGLIKTSNGGYCLAEWITVRDGEGEVGAKESHVAKTPVPQSRRERILAELETKQLRAPALAAALKCSVKTVQRELDSLRKDGLVEFEGPPRTGAYRMSSAAS